VRGIERRRLERLFEAVDVDQDVSSAAGLREKIADLSRHRLDRIKTPIAKPGHGERETAVVRLHQRRPCDGHRGSPAPAQTRASPAHRSPACVWFATSNVGSTESDEASKRAPVAPKLVHPPTASRLAEGRKPRAGERAAGRNALVLQQTSDDHTEPSGTLPVSDPPLFLES